ncbi:sodium:proton antiporter [Candidatus Marinamargulisbacteria bacterium SCGC AG-410-N11]|nr:sodium:proton antiporter [Candidatus Marinamargulisbacteria bacterium SCGC AG-410-N11]
MILNIISILFFTAILYFSSSPLVFYLLNGLSICLILLGLFFFLGTSIGVIRFPDFYTRMHAAGKGDTLSSILILFGIALFVLNTGTLSIGLVLVCIKILLIINFIFIGSPTATHAIMDAGYGTEVKHWTNDSEGIKKKK